MTDSPCDLPSVHRPHVVNVTTGSRLHFGLLRTAHPFGGLGVMIDAPMTSVAITAAETFSCVDETAEDRDAVERACRVAQRFADFHRMPQLPPCTIHIRQRPPAHAGLGSGTQLAMAVAQALTTFAGKRTSDTQLASEIAGRGERSAVGIHGFFHGGLLLENTATEEPSTLCRHTPSINPLASRYDVPTSWRVAVFRPRDWIATVSGESEKEHFGRTPTLAPASLARLIAIAEHEVLPAVAGAQFDAFADAIQRFNRESGLLFQRVQGGPYNGPVITRLVETLQSLGAVGIGQSSWGPSVFCWFKNDADAFKLVARVPHTIADGFITTARNVPHRIH